MPSALVLDGASGPALAVTRSLGRAGWRVYAQAGTRSARSRFATGTVIIPDSARDPDGFGRYLRAVLGELEISLLVPATDASVELAWENADALGDGRILGGDRHNTQLCLDKASTLAAADAHGFPTPRWFAPADLDEADAALAELGLPLVVKPRRSYARWNESLQHRRHAVADTEERFRQCVRELAEPDGALPVLQALVPGRACAVSAVVHSGDVLAYVARETLSFEPVSGGTSVWKRTISPDSPGVHESLDLLRGIGYEGLAEVEYQADGDRVCLMEIGARVHGWVPLAIAAGVDLPLIAARAAMGEPTAGPREYKVGAEMRWIAGEVARVRTALSRQPNLPPGVSRGEVLASAVPPWKPGMRYDGLDVTDLGPWFPRSFAALRRRRRNPAKTRGSR